MLKKKFGKGLLFMLAFVMIVSLSFFAYGDSAIGKNKGRVGQTETQKNAQAVNMGLYGGQPEDIAVYTNGGNQDVYINNFASSGLFSSRDLGSTWTGLSSSDNFGVGKAVEVDQNTGHAYALIGDSLLKSTNHGVTWSEIQSNTDHWGGTNWGFLYAHSRLLVGLTNGNVAISTDGGTNFSQATIESGSEVSYLAASPTANVYYAVITQGETAKLFMSNDGGSIWTNLNVHSAGVTAGNRFGEVGVNQNNGNQIVLVSSIGEYPSYQSLDGGTSWTAMTENGQNKTGGYVAWDSTSRMYIGQSYTADNGSNWSQMNVDTPLSSIYADNFAIDPNNDNVLFTNSAMGVAKSIDRGVSWTDQVQGITSVKVFGITQADKKKYVWLGANGGLARTTNFNASSPDWQYPILPTAGISNVKAVWVKPNNSAVVVSGTNAIYRSTNGRDAIPAWTAATAPNFNGNLQMMVSHPKKDNVVFAISYNDDLAGVDKGSVLKSTDSGATWTDLNLTGNAPAISLDVAKDGTLYVGIGGDASTKGVYKYSGGKWSKPSTKLNNFQVTSILVDPNDKKIIYATADKDPMGGGFYKSENSGKTWKKISKGIKNVSHLRALTVQKTTNPNTLYMSGQAQNLNGAIYKSSDGGETWGKYYEGLKQETFYSLLFDGLAAGNDRGLYEMKSRASLILKTKKKAKKGARVTVTVTLKDKATKKKLKKKKITMMKKTKKKNKFKKFRTVRTNKKGKVTFKVKIKAKKRLFLKAKWKRSKKNKREYAVTKSKRKRVKVQK